MRMREDCGYRVRSYWAAAPARAREILRIETESLATTDPTSGGAAAAPALDPRVADLRARVQRGEYKVDVEALSRKIVEEFCKRVKC